MSLGNDKIEEVHQEQEMANLNRYITIESVADPARDNSPKDPAVAHSEADYRVYKRRFFGLGQLVLLNIVVSWDVRETCV